LKVGDRVTDSTGAFRGKLLGPSGTVYDVGPKRGEVEIRLWAVENVRTREVRHLREDRLTPVRH
jgi:hypothetical protein